MQFFHIFKNSLFSTVHKYKTNKKIFCLILSHPWFSFLLRHQSISSRQSILLEESWGLTGCVKLQIVLNFSVNPPLPGGRELGLCVKLQEVWYNLLIPRFLLDFSWGGFGWWVSGEFRVGLDHVNLYLFSKFNFFFVVVLHLMARLRGGCGEHWSALGFKILLILPNC